MNLNLSERRDMKLSTFLKSLIIVATMAVFAGCASVPMASKNQDAASKEFKAPPPNKSGLYIYRNNFTGKSLKRTLTVDGVNIGATANRIYFHKEIPPGTHTLSTESEFGDNSLVFTAEGGKNYYFRQYIKMGVFVGGSGIESVTEEEGQNAILECSEAK